jgi:hypothetical protein
MDSRMNAATILSGVFQRDGDRCYDCQTEIAISEAVLLDLPVEDDGSPVRIRSRSRALCRDCAKERRQVARALSKLV